LISFYRDLEEKLWIEDEPGFTVKWFVLCGENYGISEASLELMLKVASQSGL
jgi:hypothetical protein